MRFNGLAPFGWQAFRRAIVHLRASFYWRCATVEAKLQPSMKRRSRPIFGAAAVLLLMALVAGASYVLIENAGMTPEKLADYVRSTDLAKLSAKDRARAIEKFAAKVNALSTEDRRRWRWEGTWRPWFMEMTEEERSRFVEATLPTGFKQVINSFEELPEITRKQSIDDAMKHLRETHQLPMNREPGQSTDAYGTNGPPPYSPELEKKVLALGLKTFYSESSAQTKAELAPLIEELQHQLQNGRPYH
jgi:hypothetical protein